MYFWNVCIKDIIKQCMPQGPFPQAIIFNECACHAILLSSNTSMIQALALKHSLSLFRAPHAEWCPLANHMPLPHQHHEEEKAENRKEAHHAIDPADINSAHPLVDIEINTQPHHQAHTINRNNRLGSMAPETLADIVHRNRNAHQAADRDENLPDRKHYPVQMIQQRCAHQAQPNRLQNKTRQPQRMQAIFGLPGAAVAPR